MILSAIGLGLSTGVFCMGYCVPILAPLLLAQKHTGWRSGGMSLALFLAGRLCGYLLIGVIVGVVGSATQDVALVHHRIIPILFIVLGILMIVFGTVQRFPHLSVCRWVEKGINRRYHLFIAGLIMGVNICPPFLLAASFAVSLTDILRSVVFFFFFFLATTVFLLPFIFVHLATRLRWVRVAARWAAVGAGIWFIVKATEKLL